MAEYAYRIGDDIRLVQELLGCSRKDLAACCGVSEPTLNRWVTGDVVPSENALLSFYDYVFEQGIRLTSIKAQLYREEFESQGHIVLFHGSKTGLNGLPSLDYCRNDCDFGRGFYCGEGFEQPAMFVANYPSSSLYAFSFDPNDLVAASFSVNRDWMLAVAYFRGKLLEYESHPILRELARRVDASDYIVAPIADNRMFEIIDSFAEGEITDVQCQHCLFATDLGKQYVLRSDRALRALTMLEHCFLSASEKVAYLENRTESTRIGRDKVKIARRQYRNQGMYIEELFA